MLVTVEEEDGFCEFRSWRGRGKLSKFTFQGLQRGAFWKPLSANLQTTPL